MNPLFCVSSRTGTLMIGGVQFVMGVAWLTIWSTQTLQDKKELKKLFGEMSIDVGILDTILGALALAGVLMRLPSLLKIWLFVAFGFFYMNLVIFLFVGLTSYGRQNKSEVALELLWILRILFFILVVHDCVKKMEAESRRA